MQTIKEIIAGLEEHWKNENRRQRNKNAQPLIDFLNQILEIMDEPELDSLDNICNLSFDEDGNLIIDGWDEKDDWGSIIPKSVVDAQDPVNECKKIFARDRVAAAEYRLREAIKEHQKAIDELAKWSKMVV